LAGTVYLDTVDYDELRFGAVAYAVECRGSAAALPSDSRKVPALERQADAGSELVTSPTPTLPRRPDHLVAALTCDGLLSDHRGSLNASSVSS